MKTELPALAENYIRLSNAQDADAAARCFSGEAVVHDDGRVHRGSDAIRDWIRASCEQYAATIAVAAYRATDKGGVVTGDVHGNFPGSPLRMHFDFTFGANAIDALEVSV